MKSITFTVLKDKLISGEKDQTTRVTFVPTFIEGEIVRIVFKENGTKEELFKVRITDIYTKRLKDLTEEEAIRDGFSSLKEFLQELEKLNGLRGDYDERYCFVIRFKKLSCKLHGHVDCDGCAGCKFEKNNNGWCAYTDCHDHSNYMPCVQDISRDCSCSESHREGYCYFSFKCSCFSNGVLKELKYRFILDLTLKL